MILKSRIISANYYIAKMFYEYKESIYFDRAPSMEKIKYWGSFVEDAFMPLGEDAKELGDVICTFFYDKGNYDRELLEFAVNLIEIWDVFIVSVGGYDSLNTTDVFIENLFNSCSSKRALLSYINAPFLQVYPTSTHTNQLEAMHIAGVLDEMGYRVDVMYFRYSFKAEVNKYDLVFGFGKEIDELAKKLDSTTKKICYTTGASPHVATLNEVNRLKEFAKRHDGIVMPYECASLELQDLEAQAAYDAAIILGGKWTENTYRGMFKRTFRQNATGFRINNIFKENMTSRKKSFICYGNYATIHKGLDLCIEAFSEMPEYELFIIGKVQDYILDFYSDTFAKSKNIHVLGFMENDNPTFLDACSKSAFCLNPSCSEGQATSVLVMMLAGIIPIVSEETGIDFEESGIVRIEDCTVDGIKDIVQSVSKIDDTTLNSMSEHIKSYALEHHTEEAYKKMLKQNLMNIIGE